MSTDPVERSIQRQQLNKSVSELIGLLSGIAADGYLHDLEIRYLQTWLTDRRDVISIWPGDAIASAIEAILSDGRVTEGERAHLLDSVTKIIGHDFADTGAVTAAPSSSPIDDSIHVLIAGSGVCHTGEFMFGTRAACERLTVRAGGRVHSTVTRKVDFVVIGTHASKAWAQTPFGRKIEAAMALRAEGHRIAVISEERWIGAIRNCGISATT